MWCEDLVCPYPKRILEDDKREVPSRVRMINATAPWLRTHILLPTHLLVLPPHLTANTSLSLSFLYPHPFPIHTHTHTQCALRTSFLLMFGQGHSQADSPRIELSSVSPQASVRVCECHLGLGVYWGRPLSTCTCWGVRAETHRALFDNHIGDGENMTNNLWMWESPRGFFWFFFPSIPPPPLLLSTCSVHTWSRKEDVARSQTK